METVRVAGVEAEAKSQYSSQKRAVTRAAPSGVPRLIMSRTARRNTEHLGSGSAPLPAQAKEELVFLPQMLGCWGQEPSRLLPPPVEHQWASWVIAAKEVV